MTNEKDENEKELIKQISDVPIFIKINTENKKKELIINEMKKNMETNDEASNDETIIDENNYDLQLLTRFLCGEKLVVNGSYSSSLEKKK